MKSVFITSLIAIIAVGCGGDKNSADPAPPTESAKPSITAVPSGVAVADEAPPPVPESGGGPAPAPGTAVAEGGGVPTDKVDEEGRNVVLEGLNSQMRSYVKDNGTCPSDLSALVKAGYIPRVPTPPNGKRYVIDTKSGTVSLQNL